MRWEANQRRDQSQSDTSCIRGHLGTYSFKYVLCKFQAYTTERMKPMYSSLSLNNDQFIDDFASSIALPTPPSPTPLNYFETNPRHCITALINPFAEPSVPQLPSSYPTSIKLTECTALVSVAAVGEDKTRKSLHLGHSR